MLEVLQAVEAFGPARLLRGSFYAYPLINAFHLLAIGALVTSAILMDLRVIGCGRLVTLEATIGSLRPVAVVALVCAVLSGLVLFSVNPVDYAANPAFRIKLALLTLAIANALAFTSFRAHRQPTQLPARVMALLSILLWISVVIAGRLIGFLV